MYSEPVSFHFCIQCSLFLSQLAQLDDAKAVWRGSEIYMNNCNISYFISLHFFFLLLLDKRWCNWETLVSFSISRLCLFFSLHIFVRRNSSLWDFILVWNFKNFSSAFRSSLSVFFLEKQFSYHLLEFRRKIEKDGGQTWSVFFRKTEINI